MKYFILIFCLINLLPIYVYSQSVSGIVKNEKGEPVVFATVSLLNVKDSSIVAHSATDNNGQYRLRAPKYGNYITKVQSLGYKDQTKNVYVSNNEKNMVCNFVLKENTLFLDEVEIESRAIGIHYKQDTIIYNPKVFTDGSEIVLGDVLKKLPGIVVEDNGEIKAQGKTVDKVLLDGKDFFSGNTQVAVNNLPADIAENVEVLSNYSEYSLLEGFKSSESTVINVGVNKERFGKLSGNVSLGAGARDKYYTKGNIMQIKPKYMLSLLESINNTGGQVFSFEDYFAMKGGILEFFSGDGQTNIEISDEEARLLMPLPNTYSKVNGLSALNFSYQPNSKLKLNSYLLFNKDKSKSENLLKYLYNINDTLSYTSENKSNSISDNNLISGYVKANYKPSSTFNIIYNGTISSSEMNIKSNSYNTMFNQSISDYGKDNFRSINTEHKAVLIKAIDKHLLLTNLSFNYTDKPSYYEMHTDSLLLPIIITPLDGWYYLRQNKRTKTLNTSLSSSFLYKFNNMYFCKLQLSGNTNINDYISNVLQNGYDLYSIDSLTNDLSLIINDINTGINFTKNNGLFRFKIGTNAHLYDYSKNLPNNVYNNTNFKLNSNLELSLYFSEKHVLSLLFSEFITPNSTSSFGTGIIFNSNHTYTQNIINNDIFSKGYKIGVNYRIFNHFSSIALSLYGEYAKTKNSMVYDYYQYGMLYKYQAVLSPDKENIHLNINFNKGFDVPWSLRLDARYMNDLYFNKVEGLENRVKVDNIAGKFQILSNYKIFNTELSVKLSYVKNNPTLYMSSEQIVKNYSGNLKLNLKNKFFTYFELEYINNDLVGRSKEFCYLNASLRYAFTKKFEVELIGSNLLNLLNQEWVELSYNANYSIENYYRKMPGNIMLKANLKF